MIFPCYMTSTYFLIMNSIVFILLTTKYDKNDWYLVIFHKYTYFMKYLWNKIIV